MDTLQALEIGATYNSGKSTNPFAKVLRVVILDVKKGYVKYMLCSPGNIEWSLPEETFRNCYPTKENKQ